MSPEARDLCMKLMARNPMSRLGAVDTNDIKNHPFFEDVNWEVYKTASSDGIEGIYPPKRKRIKVTDKKKERGLAERDNLKDPEGITSYQER